MKIQPYIQKMPVFARFLLAGGTAAAANFFSRIGFSLLVSYPVAIVLAFGVGIITAFLLNRLFVFDISNAQHSAARQLWYFFLVNLLALAQTLIISLLLAKLLHLAGLPCCAETIAHGVGILVPVFSSYWGHRRLTFRQKMSGS
jgi:putative flippase GtrA